MGVTNVIQIYIHIYIRFRIKSNRCSMSGPYVMQGCRHIHIPAEKIMVSFQCKKIKIILNEFNLFF